MYQRPLLPSVIVAAVFAVVAACSGPLETPPPVCAMPLEGPARCAP